MRTDHQRKLDRDRKRKKYREDEAYRSKVRQRSKERNTAYYNNDPLYRKILRTNNRIHAIREQIVRWSERIDRIDKELMRLLGVREKLRFKKKMRKELAPK